MQSKNLNYRFHKEYYENTNFINTDVFSGEQKNRELCSYKLITNMIPDPVLGPYLALKAQSFLLQTTYPGLLLGTGISHAFGGKGEVALGFTFDYVTGLPYIPGPSLKGLLRSAFTLANGAYIGEKLKLHTGIEWQGQNIKHLEYSIFGPRQKDHSTEADGRDIFFDSFIAGPQNQTFLAMDTITPHGQGALGELSSPNPISFIKVKPNVKFEFRFLLSDYDENGFSLSADKKTELFKEILLDLGIGAKSNVGYGALTLTSEDRKAAEQANANQVTASTGGVSFAKGKEYTGTVKDFRLGKTNFVNISLEGYSYTPNIPIDRKQLNQLRNCSKVVVIYQGEKPLSDGRKKLLFTIKEIQ